MLRKVLLVTILICSSSCTTATKENKKTSLLEGCWISSVRADELETIKYFDKTNAGKDATVHSFLCFHEDKVMKARSIYNISDDYYNDYWRVYDEEYTKQSDEYMTKNKTIEQFEFDISKISKKPDEKNYSYSYSKALVDIGVYEIVNGNIEMITKNSNSSLGAYTYEIGTLKEDGNNIHYKKTNSLEEIYVFGIAEEDDKEQHFTKIELSDYPSIMVEWIDEKKFEVSKIEPLHEWFGNSDKNNKGILDEARKLLADKEQIKKDIETSRLLEQVGNDGINSNYELYTKWKEMISLYLYDEYRNSELFVDKSGSYIVIRDYLSEDVKECYIDYRTLKVLSKPSDYEETEWATYKCTPEMIEVGKSMKSQYEELLSKHQLSIEQIEKFVK